MQDGLDGLLPEEFPYEDKGCDLWQHCLDCPFPTCIEEEPWGKERFLYRRRAERMVELKEEGKSTREIARIFGVSSRTVQRGLKAWREARGRDSSVVVPSLGAGLRLTPQNDKVGASE